MKSNDQSLQDRRTREMMEALSSISTDCVEGGDVPTRTILAKHRGTHQAQRGKERPEENIETYENYSGLY
jgi:hypothetical protein